MADKANGLSFRTYVVEHTQFLAYMRANLRLVPLNLAVTVGLLMLHFQPAWAR